jgi:hypothetical protein
LKQVLSAIVLIAGLGSPSFAQSDRGSLRFPSIFGIPSALPAPGGSGYVGLVLVHPRRDTEVRSDPINQADGDLLLGYTFGNPVRGVSAHVGATITSLIGFAEDGALQASLSRALHVSESSATFAGVSATNVAAWGDAADGPPAYAAYLSHLFTVNGGRGEMPVQLTIGYGDHAATADGSGINDQEPFVGIGVGVSQSINLSLSGTTKEIYAGMGFALRKLPRWNFSLGVFDVTQAQGHRQLALTIARGF